MKKSALVLALLAFTALPCLADSPFAGKWKLDTAKSTFTGTTFTYSMTPAGLLHFSDGAFEADFDPSGKPHASFSNVMTTWTRVDDHTWDDEGKIGDKVASRTHRVLSADGNTMTANETDYRPDGTEDHATYVFQRVSGGPGIVGTWKNVKADPPPSSLSIAVPAPGQIDLEDTDYKVSVAGPTDGTFFPIKGPLMPEGFTISYTPSGANKLEYINKMKDKVVGKGVLTVDGNTLTDVSWTPGKESEKTTAVYQRQ